MHFRCNNDKDEDDDNYNRNNNNNNNSNDDEPRSLPNDKSWTIFHKFPHLSVPCVPTSSWKTASDQLNSFICLKCLISPFESGFELGSCFVSKDKIRTRSKKKYPFNVYVH